MIGRTFKGITIVLAMLVPVLAISCSDGDSGLSRAEVEEIARAELAKAPTPVPVDPGLTAAEAERIVQAAIGSISEPEPGLTLEEVREAIRAAMSGIPEPEVGPSAAEIREIARNVVASIPPKSAPADYTRFFVDNAISRYESEGLEATLAYYNREESVDGQWYVFIIDQDDKVIGHYNAHLLGEDLKGPIGTDANGYNFGPEMLSATDEGKWVSYVYSNPESGGLGSGAFELKNVWVTRHDGLLFASGWYINADDFTKKLVSVAVERFRAGGLPATIAYFAAPGGALAGLESTIAYYNNADTVEGEWFAFIADTNGKIVAHNNLQLQGSDLADLYLFGEDLVVTQAGDWVTAQETDPEGRQQSMRVWVAGFGGMTFGSGWYNDGSG